MRQGPGRHRRPDQPGTVTVAHENTRSLPARATSRAVVQEQQEDSGGMKFGSCYFGWLTATGTALPVDGAADRLRCCVRVV